MSRCNEMSGGIFYSSAEMYILTYVMKSSTCGCYGMHAQLIIWPGKLWQYNRRWYCFYLEGMAW